MMSEQLTNRTSTLATYVISLSLDEWQKLVDGESVENKLMCLPGHPLEHVEVIIQRPTKERRDEQ